jgi:hypothetical protein
MMLSDVIGHKEARAWFVDETRSRIDSAMQSGDLPTLRQTLASCRNLGAFDLTELHDDLHALEQRVLELHRRESQ